MRLRPRLAWLASAALAALTLAACGIDARSPLYRCEGPSDCASGRVCRDGWCVVAGDENPIDAGITPPPPDAAVVGEPDAASCPAPCTSCDQDTCTVDCSVGGSCPDLVVCPPDLACIVVCAGTDSCGAGVDCSAASSCDIGCTARDACSGAVVCGAGPCEVDCSQRQACTGGVDCSDSCSCETRCSGFMSCHVQPQCPFFFCSDGFDCSAVGPGCDQCAPAGA